MFRFVCLSACLTVCLPDCLHACLSACLPACLSVCLPVFEIWANKLKICSNEAPNHQHHYTHAHITSSAILTETLSRHLKHTHTHTRAHVEVSDYRLLGQKSDVTDMHETLHRRAWTLFMGCQIRCAVVTETTCLSGLPAIWTYVILLVNDNQYKWLYLKGTQMKQWRYIWILLPLTTTRILRPFSQCYPGKRC